MHESCYKYASNLLHRTPYLCSFLSADEPWSSWLVTKLLKETYEMKSSFECSALCHSKHICIQVTNVTPLYTYKWHKWHSEHVYIQNNTPNMARYTDNDSNRCSYKYTFVRTHHMHGHVRVYVCAIHTYTRITSHLCKQFITQDVLSFLDTIVYLLSNVSIEYNHSNNISRPGMEKSHLDRHELLVWGIVNIGYSTNNVSKKIVLALLV